MRLTAVLLGLLLFGLLLVSFTTGIQIGLAAENTTELDRQINTIEANYTETAEENLSMSYKEWNDDPKYEWREPLDRAAYTIAVKPVLWFGRTSLYISAAVLEYTARVTYRYS